jgi:hypothetical protein
MGSPVLGHNLLPLPLVEHPHQNTPFLMINAAIFKPPPPSLGFFLHMLAFCFFYLQFGLI